MGWLGGCKKFSRRVRSIHLSTLSPLSMATAGQDIAWHIKAQGINSLCHADIIEDVMSYYCCGISDHLRPLNYNRLFHSPKKWRYKAHKPVMQLFVRPNPSKDTLDKHRAFKACFRLLAIIGFPPASSMPALGIYASSMPVLCLGLALFLHAIQRWHDSCRGEQVLCQL